MESNPLELPKEWVVKIEANAKSVSGHQPDEDSTPFRNGMYSGYKSGALAYAPWLYTCQMNYAALKAKCDRYEKALKGLKEYTSSCAEDASHIDHDEIIDRITEALSGEGEKEVNSGMFTVAKIGGFCSNSNCKYCHGTGEIKVISETTSSISYYDCWGENGGLACLPKKTEFIDVMAFEKWRQENRWFDYDGTYWNYTFEHPTAISEKEYNKNYRKTTLQLYELYQKGG